MYQSTTKSFHCNHCQKKIKTDEECWIKQPFPPKVTAFQDKPIKTLEYKNAPILCLECATTIFSEKIN
ncbi:hypothetical protein [Vagococcus sp.]|uniref:hypothetical protein n=1 Tax=Vagococcus sp. TaxID=1933889 RepID=UPI003F9C3E70